MADEINLASGAGNGNGTTIERSRFNHLEESHMRTLYVWGTFGGGTGTLQISPDGTNWFNVPNADAITAASVLNVEFRAPYIRFNFTGGTTPSINAQLL